MLPDLCAIVCPGERVHALPLQYVKISAALHLMRQAEEKMGTRFALVVRLGRCFGVRSASSAHLCLNRWKPLQDSA